MGKEVKGNNKRGRTRRMDYDLMVALYNYNYNTILIGRILDTPNGHVSKVLRSKGVEMRKRGERVRPVPFHLWDEITQLRLMEDADLYNRFKFLIGVEKGVEMVTLQDLMDKGYLGNVG